MNTKVILLQNLYNGLTETTSICCLQAIEQSLRSVRLFAGGVADKLVGKYSGGMKRRLSVAISLIGDPKVFLFINWDHDSELRKSPIFAHDVKT